MCTKFADPALAGVVPNCGPAVVGAAGMSARHGPLRVAHGRSPAIAGVAGMSAGHGSLRVARGRSLAVAVGLRWTCGPHSSAGGQQ